MLHAASSPHPTSSLSPSDEPYARQLARGFAQLQFEPLLEAEYRRSLNQEQRRAAIICGLVALVIWSGFAILDFVRLDVINQGVRAPDLFVLLASRLTVLAILLLVLATPLRNILITGRAAFVIYVSIGMAGAITSVIYKANGLPSADIAQIVVVMAAFLPMGMTFYAALLAALSLVLVTAIAGLSWLQAPLLASHMVLTLVMALAVPVGAVGGYLREYSHRHQFLLTAILSRQAQFDPLTDLANRRLFQRHADAVIAHAARHEEPLVLAILDIDHFKDFNDRFGHAAGDRALYQVAEVIRSAARRPMDMPARLGGEEFALLLYGCDMAGAEPVLENLRNRVTAIDFDQPDAQPLTISIGATSPQPGEALSHIYDRADRLLYASKADGRDRISTG